MRLGLVGDVHTLFDALDARALDEQGYDAVLFAGDLAGYSHRGVFGIARAIGAMRTPAIVIPGNHDAAHAPQLVAEMMANDLASDVLSIGHAQRVDQIRALLAPAVLAGYSAHRLEARGEHIEVIAARPHSFGGPRLSLRGYLRSSFGVGSLEDSAARLCELVDRASSDRIVFLAHNGPSGLGSKRDDIWGCDFRKSEGDWGDSDLRAAIEHARRIGKKVVAVLAGHMHHKVRGGGARTWTAREGETLYVNAARVPRIWRTQGQKVRHHVEITIDGARAEAHERLVPDRSTSVSGSSEPASGSGQHGRPRP